MKTPAPGIATFATGVGLAALVLAAFLAPGRASASVIRASGKVGRQSASIDCPAPCNDGNPCTDDRCNHATGQCVYTNDDTNSCSDGNACTVDVCLGGACVGTPSVVCDDGNPCTDDTCNLANGQCVYTNDDTNSCSDGDPCTTDSCASGACVGSQVLCDDANSCTDDLCNPANGQCTHTNDDTNSCSDGSACTTDACLGGTCVGTPVVFCDDGKPCTDDLCNPANGQCAYINDDTNSCSDGDTCTTDACVGGQCVGTHSGSCDVPLTRWKDDNFPDGLTFGGTMGVSWGDYDADGLIDLFAAYSGSLWRNVNGTTWQFAGNLSSLVPPSERRYGSSFGDYDKDGFPDIAMAPRVPLWGDDRFHLLRNLGGGPNFVDVAADPTILDVQPYGNAETLCWADVDGDANLDLFIPVYPGSGPGNFFLYNLGPTGPGGAYRFAEQSGPVGLDNPPGTSRPEGAQFADVDFDGDVDLFSNGTLYQNVSAPLAPSFLPLPESASGIGLRDSLDEGAMFFDYDLDGDQDLFVAYTSDGVRIWENYGDGTFFAAEPTIVDSRFTGLNLGMSAEDWDNDGDIDFTTREVFRRNMLVEEHARHFVVATHSIPAEHLYNATPAWGDWDRDGDLDCVIGNWGESGRLYANTLYTPVVPQGDRRYVRVRVVRDTSTSPRGLETEYGATAEIHVLNDPGGFRRRKFVASGHGYLNQNEYALHFALPPGDDVRFDLSVDFPSSAEGLWRVDQHVNPVLRSLGLATLADREIQVDRSGEVVIGGVAYDPIPLASPRLTTTAGGLALTGAKALKDPTPTPHPDWYVGLSFDTLNATESLAVREIILDGQLAPPPACGEDRSVTPSSATPSGSAAPRTLASTSETRPSGFNLSLWDVTDSPPFLVSGGAMVRQTSPRNHRSYFPVDIVLEPGRFYRLAARVASYRPSTITAAVDRLALDVAAQSSSSVQTLSSRSGETTVLEPVTVHGGISYEDPTPCVWDRMANASIDPTAVFLALRFAPVTTGSCLSGVPSSCDDGKVCTDDSCGTLGACVHANNSATCDDGNVCTTADQCTSGTCTGTPVDCDDGNPCTTDSCDPASGCTHTNNTAPCDDGNVCTTVDVCSSGQCQGVVARNCDDGNLCTDDACDPVTGCFSTPDDTNTCTDGNLCTSGDACVSGSCIGTPISCNDANACTTDGCIPTYGCTHTWLEVTGVGWIDKTTLVWDSSGSGASYDVATGDVGELPVLGSGASESCLAPDILTTSTPATATPAPGTPFWYLVRAGNAACGVGTYGFGYASGAPSAERILTVCP